MRTARAVVPVPSSQSTQFAASANAVAATPFDLAETVAQVGDQYILRGELIGDANLRMSSMFAQLDKVPADQREAVRHELLDMRERMVTEQLLPETIERKIKFLEFQRSLPVESDVKKVAEREQKIQTQAGKMFTENLDKMAGEIRNAPPEKYQEIGRTSRQLFYLSLLMKEKGIWSTGDPRLEIVLKQHGTSLAKQQKAFMEFVLGQNAIRGKVNFQPEITHDQMLRYYREHEAEFQVPLKAKWEQLSVLFKRMANREAAMNEICSMGNQVYFGGAPFGAVAKRRSQEKNAEKMGLHDWTTCGDLTVSRAINEAVFSLPLNQLSPIITDEDGYHIVRVLDRADAHVTPFEDAQDDIKDKLKEEALTKAYGEYVAKLKARTPVIVTARDARTPRR